MLSLRDVGLWLALAGSVGLTGCGTVTVPASPAATGLGGNWLIAGSLPFLDPLHLQGSQGFGLAMTFTVTGNQIAGGGSDEISCGTMFSFGGAGNVVAGTIANDGTFTVESPASTPAAVPTIAISGVAPKSGESTWSGTYTYKYTPPTTNSGSCTGTFSGPFTAVRIADVTGVYQGTTTLIPGSGSTLEGQEPVVVSLSLQQGGVLPGTTQVNAATISGTMQVQGGSCFSNGTITGVVGVEGTTFLVTFKMDDGSTVNLVGDVVDVGSSQITIHGLLGSGGKCGLISTGPFEIVRS